MSSAASTPPPARESSGAPLSFQGYLQKRGHLIRSYRTRYFIVRGNVFAYYKNAEDAARHDFRGAHVVTGAELNKENEVVIRTYLGKSFTVRSAPDMPDETVLDARDIHRIFEDAAKLKVKGSQETLQSFTPSSNAEAGQHYQVGIALAQQLLLPQAVTSFNEAIRMDPNFLAAYSALGEAHFCMGNLAEALRVFELGRSRYRKSLNLSINYGALLTMTGSAMAAKGLMNELITLHGDKPAFRQNLGCTLMELGEHKQAIENFDAAIHASTYAPPSPSNIHFNALLGKGDALLMSGETTAATRCYEEALAHDDANIDALLCLGRACMKLGKAEQSISVLRKVLQIDPSNVEANKWVQKSRINHSGT